MSAVATRVQSARTPANVRDVALDPELARTLRRLSGRADEAMTKRDMAILDARKAGASLREIEAATGINYVTVRRLIARYEPGMTKDDHRLAALDEMADEIARRDPIETRKPKTVLDDRGNNVMKHDN